MTSALMIRSFTLLAMLSVGPLALGQGGGALPVRPQGPPQPAQKAAPIDLTGYWVSVVTEDWRWRMLTPPHGDYASVPLNPQGKQLADMWTSDEDGSCKAYGAAGLMRMPTRLHITWASPEVLKIETDWGQQTRMIYFKKSDLPQSGPTLQGSSFAVWQFPQVAGAGGPPGRGPQLPGGKLYVLTDNLSPGWLRRNGVPYGSQTHLSEWFQVFDDPSGKHWFDVTTRVDDPEYLLAPFITSSDFRKEPDGSKWSPHPCKQ